MSKLNGVKMRKIILVVGLMLIIVLLLSGCAKRESGELIKKGSVVRIEYNVIFGGTFTDWRDDIYFSDGTVLSSQGRDLSRIILNKNGSFYFDKNYFEYDDVWYKFDNFKYVIYDDE